MLFESERLIFRVWHKNDLESGMKLWGNDQVMALIEPALSQEQVGVSIDRGVEHYNNYGVQLFAMVLKETNQIIGCCGLSVDDFENKVYEFCIHIMPAFQKQRFGYEAGQAVLIFAESIDIKKIIAACHMDNIGSKALLRKLGFKYIKDIWFDDTNRLEAYYEMEKS